MRALLISGGKVAGTLSGPSIAEVAANNPTLQVVDDTFGIERVVGMDYANGFLSGEATPEPVSQPHVPQSVTMRQARLALLGAGMLSGVDAAIAGLPEPSRSAAKIEWEYASEVQRSSGLVPAMASALGMSEAQLDQLFISAFNL